MAIVSSYTAHTGALLATGDKIYVADVSDGTSGSQSITMDELLIGLPRLGFNPATTGLLKVNGTTQINWNDGAFYAETNNDVDLGTSSVLFKNGYLVNVDLGKSGTAGTVDIFPTTASKGKIQIAAADSAGDTTTTITNASQSGARTYTIPDAGASANFVMSTGTTTGIAVTSTEFGVLAGVTPGTAAASKAVVLDSNKDVASLRNLTVTNLDAGASGTAGTVDVFPSTAAKGKLQIAVTDQTGDTTVTMQIGAMAAARTVTLADPGGAANFLTDVGIGGTLLARASAQFDATSGSTGTTLTNVTGMVLTVIPATYKYRVCLPGTATANSGIKAAFKLTTTVLTSIEATGLAYTASAVVVQHTTTTADQTAQIASTTAAIYTVLEGSMVVGTGGTIQIQAAQNASHADTTSVYAGATFELTRIA